MKKETKKPKKEELEIEGLIDRPRWYDLKCVCAQDPKDIEHRYPIFDCNHCKFQHAEDDFKKLKERGVWTREKDETAGIIAGAKEGKPVQVKKMKILRGPKYEDIIAVVWL